MKLSAIAASALTVFSLLFVGATTRAQDIAKIGPTNVKVLPDNDQVRVYKEHYRPGDKIGMHSHPAYVIYVLTSGKFKLTSPTGDANEREVTAGSALYREPVTHSSEWLGPGEGRFLIVELKRSPAT